MSSRSIYRRELKGSRLASFTVIVKETDLWIAVDSELNREELALKTETFTWRLRHEMEAYLKKYPHLLESLEPCLVGADAPDILRRMVAAANQAGVGPMAAVAGAVAEAVGRQLLDLSREVIVENGGDIFLKVDEPVQIGIYAGSSPLSGKFSLLISDKYSPLGVCTSSGTVGPSFSYGYADAAVAVSPSTALADAVATAMGNLVKTKDDLEKALHFAQKINGITGALLIRNDKIAAWGDIELHKI
ncbi:MAG: UPF0280 family protein [Dethiobacteria bacterium]